ncbi:UcrQ-domain-containing protein [Aaosphaeria arxii CBS 175.79]|uniref:Cytochrome b-c1 complex subunit 8 n=1 Tax=Aaosphaeria arxii CBS 175.79 TaxID=1450172 RepID=A0A6A5Y4J2_9PLEO|nr:UcrQ-domain-containing protein [Aaosphaeria arxii CBS 175.79]KAF2020472.1 UcrQ-domain-containing protein [Aaosphaeria arxii CBS 175.79]
MAGGASDKTARIKNTWHIGSWGNPLEGGGQPSKGIYQYALSANRQRPFAGAFTKGFWNTIRRSRNQVLYVVPPFILAYSAMQWAIERNEYLNSKAGRAEFGDEE